jgi:sugar phosphate isomerase/epimerase
MKTSVGLFLTDILPHRRKIFSKIIKNKILGKDPEAFALMKKSGIEGIELFLPSFTKFTSDDIREARKIVEANKMSVFSVHQALRFFSKTRIAEITKLFQIADTLSAKVIVLHLNLAGKQIFDAEYRETLLSLQSKYGIKVGFENKEKYFHTRGGKHSWHGDHFSDLMKEKGFYITFDVTHLAANNEDIIKFFKNNKERIINIHLSDYRKHYLNSSLRPFRYKHLALGKGQLPIKEFLKTLHQEEYKGLVTMEIHTDLEGICESANMIRSARL